MMNGWTSTRLEQDEIDVLAQRVGSIVGIHFLLAEKLLKAIPEEMYNEIYFSKIRNDVLANTIICI